MKKYFLIPLVMLSALMTACQDWEAPEPDGAAMLEPNMTIQEFKRLYAGSPVEITNDTLVITGIVNSSDASGNFYRSFYIQDETGGIEIKIGKTGLYNDYPEGMRIFIKPKYLCLGAYGGMVQLGAVSTEERYETSYIDAQALIDRTIFKGGVDAPCDPLVITQASEINDNVLGVLVTLQQARYTGGDDGLMTWAVAEDAENGIEAASGNQNFDLGGKKVVVRSSGYADFATAPVPAVGSLCNLTGIMTKYNSTYQLVLIDLNGVEVL